MTVEELKVVSDVKNQAGEHHGWAINCPGCKQMHVLDKRWTFNGDYIKPTFRASLLCKWDMERHGLPNKICHSFITDGKIEFLNDCTHELKGQTVALEKFND